MLHPRVQAWVLTPDTLNPKLLTLKPSDLAIFVLWLNVSYHDSHSKEYCVLVP